jgi:putative FmdB family regulatory protein
MPTYVYACTNPDCGHQFEAVQAFSDDALTVCPVCGQRLRKVFGSVGVVFKGSGFYRNDSREKATNGSAKGGAAGEKSGASSETATSASTSAESGSSSSGKSETSSSDKPPAKSSAKSEGSAPAAPASKSGSSGSGRDSAKAKQSS